MSLVGFEPKIPVFKQAKTVHALDGAATVIDSKCTTHSAERQLQRDGVSYPRSVL
jgi:hypothetical protein